MQVSATIAEIESLLSETIMDVKDTNNRIDKLEDAAMLMAKSYETISEAAKSMAETFKRAETRQERLETTNHALYKEKGVSPNVFFLVTGTLCTVIVMGAVWVTDSSIKATLTSFEAGRAQAKQLNEVKNEIIDEVKEEKNGK